MAFLTALFRGWESRSSGPLLLPPRSERVVRKATNPSFHRLLTEYKELSGSGIVLNTSFNIHEEPIVRTAGEAVSSFLSARLDYLAIEDYLVPAPHLESGSAPDP